MPVFNTQGLPIQLILQPDRNFADLASGLTAGQVLRGRVSEVLADGRAVVNFRGIPVTAELKGVALSRGDVINVSVQDLKGTPVFRLLPEAPQAAGGEAAGQAAAAAPAATASPIEPAIAAVLAKLDLPRDAFHAAVVQLLQGYSVEPTRVSVAAIKELLAALPAFLEEAPAALPGQPAAGTLAPREIREAGRVEGPAPAIPRPVNMAPAPEAPLAAPRPAAPVIQAAPQAIQAAAPERTAPPAPAIMEPPMPAPPVAAALSRGYMLGRLLAALEPANPPQTPQIQPQAGVGQAPTAPVEIPARADAPVPPGPVQQPAALPVASRNIPAAAAPESRPAGPVAEVLARAAAAPNPPPLVETIQAAARALDSALAGGPAPAVTPDVRQAIIDAVRDLAVVLRGAAPEPLPALGTIAERVNAAVAALPPAEPAPAQGQPASLTPALPGAPVTVAPAVRPAPAPVQAVAELAGAVAGVIHGEVAQAIQPQVTIVAAAPAAQAQAPSLGGAAAPGQGTAPARPDAARPGVPSPSRDASTGVGRTEEPRSAAPVQTALAQAVREADAPVDVPRIMAIISEAAPAMAVALAESPSPAAPEIPVPAAPATGPVVPPLREGQAQVLGGALVYLDARTEPLPAALARVTSAGPSVPAAPVQASPAGVPARSAETVPAPALPRAAAESYGATTAGGRAAQAASPAATPVSPALSGSPAQVGRDVVETAVFMHAAGLPAVRDAARAAHEFLFGDTRLHEVLRNFADAASAAPVRALPAPVRQALDTAVRVARDMEVSPEGAGVPAKLRGAVERMGLGHEARLARAVAQAAEGGARPAAEVTGGARESLKAALLDLRGRLDSVPPSMREGSAGQSLSAVRASTEDALQVVQSQQVGSFSRPDSTNVIYVQLPIQFGNELRGGEVHLSWKQDGEGKGRKRDGRVPAMMNLNVETRALGPLRVRMQLTGQNLSLVFQVNDPAIQSYLAGEFAELRGRLEGFNLRVDRISAEVGKDESPAEGPSAVIPTSSLDLKA